MAKCLLVHNGDDVHIHSFNWALKSEEISDEDFIYAMTINHPKHGVDFLDKTCVIIDDSELPDRSTRDQWMPCSENNIKIDVGWEEKLMPCWLIGHKSIKKYEAIIADELIKESPDPLILFQSNNAIEKLKKLAKNSIMGSNSDLSLYEHALENLDARVVGGEDDKPIIREKLIAKIAELKLKGE